MHSIQYDPTILQQFADKLYEQAKSIVASTITGYGLGAFILALLFVVAFGNRQNFHVQWSESDLGITVFMVAVGLLLGLGQGRKKAFMLKLRAQEALCQMQIEMNTRQRTTATA